MARFAIRSMTAGDASEIAAWRYPQPYDFYNWDRDADDLSDLLHPAGWGVKYFAADDEGGRLSGFFAFTEHDDVVELGLGLRPDLTGHGLGGDYLETGLQFASTTFAGRGHALAVAAFNQRAIAVYERAGFRAARRYAHFTNGALHDFVWMTRG